MSLCYRCEHRAKNKETKGQHQPRYECGTDDSVGSCYMFQPVKPIMLKRNEGDRRSIDAGWAFNARVHRVDIDNNILSLNVSVFPDENFIYYWNIKKEGTE